VHTLNVTAGFFIGEHSYLLEVSQDKSSYAIEVESVFDSSTTFVEEDTYVSNDQKTVRALLEFNGASYQANQFVKSLVTADDEEGLPVLLYIDAHFYVDESIDFEDLESESSVTLHIGKEEFTFYGSLEEL
jgi:hypothetical protein